MESPNVTLLMVPKPDWEALMASHLSILEQLKGLNNLQPSGITVRHITAKEFMDAVRIKRTKFDQLVAANKVRTIKKRRKIYVPVSEIDRYFNDPSIL